MADLLNPAVLRDKLKDNLIEKNEIFRKVYSYKPFGFESCSGSIVHSENGLRLSSRIPAFI
jgi:hypothetical protein